MKKITTTLAAFALLIAGLQAQTLDYSIECPKPDSCFLKEVSIAQPTQQEPRPKMAVSYLLFKSWVELDGIIEQIRKKAREETTKGIELMKEGEKLNGIADKIQAAKAAQNATADKKR